MRIFLLSYNFRKTCNMHQHFNLRPTVTKEHLPHFMVPFSNFFRIRLDCWSQTFLKIHTATSRKTVRKVVGKSARANPERYCGWFWVYCSSKKSERMAREDINVCIKVGSTATVSGTVYWSCPILPIGIVVCTLFFGNLSRNSWHLRALSKSHTRDCRDRPLLV